MWIKCKHAKCNKNACESSIVTEKFQESFFQQRHGEICFKMIERESIHNLQDNISNLD